MPGQYSGGTMRILILGASGMLGHMLFAELLRRGLDVWGSARTPFACREEWCERLRFGLDARDEASAADVIAEVAPHVVINAVGLVRQLPEGRQPLPCLMVNAVFPWRLQALCAEKGIRLIHYSTDCVFDGLKGSPYVEDDPSTAGDIYGRSKFLGEVVAENALTVRTSIIGPELRGKHSLLEWFLAQEGPVKGYTGSLYTGLPTSEQARVLAEYILPDMSLKGLYHVSAAPITKYDLLRLINTAYCKDSDITPFANPLEDKRLSGEKFREATGYTPPAWPELVEAMRVAHVKNRTDFPKRVAAQDGHSL